MFQPCNIVTDDAKAFTEALQHINIDEVFKHDYMIFAFARLPLIELVCERQVHFFTSTMGQIRHFNRSRLIIVIIFLGI